MAQGFDYDIELDRIIFPDEEEEKKRLEILENTLLKIQQIINDINTRLEALE